ncbi:MAG: PAS domain S-box protein [Siphonobacter aquaeclarae]|nr:PAS domain S-box protein [Siphonobacter aquaeclarae]
MESDFYHRIFTDLLFEQADDFIGVFDLESEEFFRINEAGTGLFGVVTKDELQVRKAIPFLTGEKLAEIRERGKYRYQDETFLTRADGRTFWARIYVDPFDINDRPYAMVRISNLEWLHRIEDQLEQNARRYEAIFDSATIGIIVSDRKGNIVSCNQLGYKLFGYPDNELTGQSIELLVPRDRSQGHEHYRESFYRHPQVRAMGHNRDLYARRKDGSIFPVEISLSYFHLEDELYAVAYIIDISFKKETEQELLAQQHRIESMNAELEQKVVDRTHALMTTLAELERSKDELSKALATERELGELKSRFVAMASHEFRTPLTTVLTSASLIEKYPESDQQDKRSRHIRRITSSVNHLNDILEEFLSVGKLEEGKVEVQLSEVDLMRLLSEIITDLQGLLKTDQVFDTRLDFGDVVWSDSAILRMILVNLLSNAIKYSGEGTLISINGVRQDNLLVLSIQDQGIGISKEDQKHLFERFFRAQNATNIQGTGLGLHIVRRYLELIGGKITLDSELNQGTTVTIVIPITEPVKTDEDDSAY